MGTAFCRRPSRSVIVVLFWRVVVAVMAIVVVALLLVGFLDVAQWFQALS